jgi:hypothetical protein
MDEKTRAFATLNSDCRIVAGEIAKAVEAVIPKGIMGGFRAKLTITVYVERSKVNTDNVVIELRSSMSG